LIHSFHTITGFSGLKEPSLEERNLAHTRENDKCSRRYTLGRRYEIDSLLKMSHQRRTTNFREIGEERTTKL
jgi:hypothetical protein